MSWFTAFPLDTLQLGHPKVLRVEDHQIVVFRTEDGAIFALDNRCPHEGYPLSQGLVCGRVVTCSWHNYKFKLEDGACVLGEEAVRSWPLRVQDGMVQVDLSPPDPAFFLQKQRASLNEALYKNEPGRAIRDLHRLLGAGVGADVLLIELAAYDAAVGEYGCTHSPAAAADLLALPELGVPADPLLCLAQLSDAVGETLRRLPRRDVAAPEVSGGGAIEGQPAVARLLQQVEAEDLAGAEALLGRMLVEGWAWRHPTLALEPVFLELASAHFLDFGHPLIYVSKYRRLLQTTPEHQRDLLLGLLANIVYATREELLPAWAGFRKRLATWTPGRIAAARLRTDTEPVAELEAELTSLSPSDALDRVWQALDERSLAAVLKALEGAAAERLWCFDPERGLSVTSQDTWLSVSHVLTYTRAVASVAPRATDAQLLRLLAFATRFIAAARPLDGPRAPLPSPESGDSSVLVPALKTAISARDLEAALHAAGGLPLPYLRDTLVDLVLHDHTAVRPIFWVHHLKTTLAAAEAAAIHSDLRGLFAVVRWMCRPGSERLTWRRTYEAREFLEHGRPPKVLGP